MILVKKIQYWNTILNILRDNKSYSSCDKNVVLGGTVFCVFDTKIDLAKIEELYNSILKSKKFSKLKLIAIQKQTYQAIIDFLATLVENDYYGQIDS